MDAPNIHIISADGQPVNMANMGANSMSQLDRNPGSSNFNFAPPLYPASYNFGNAPNAVKEEVPPKLLNNNILRVQQRGILAHTHSMDELFSIKDILNGENIDANELPITDFGNPPVIAKDGNENPADQTSAPESFQAGARTKSDAPPTLNNMAGAAVSIGKQETAVEDQRAGFDAQSKIASDQTSVEHQGSYGLETEDQEGSTYDEYNKVVPKLRFKSPKRKSPSSSEEKLIEVEEQNENDKPIVHVNKKRRFNSYQYLFSPDFDDNPNQYIDVLRTKYTLPNKSNTYFEDGGRFTEISLAIRKQRIANELAQKGKDQVKQVRVKKTLKAK
jgi:hypothetical protein